MVYKSISPLIYNNRYATRIGRLSDEMNLGMDAFSNAYVGAGLNNNFFINSGIKPYQNCYISPLKNIGKKYYVKLIPVTPNFKESWDFCENEYIILPTEFEYENYFKEGEIAIINNFI